MVPIMNLAPRAGFEPATLALEERCAFQLCQREVLYIVGSYSTVFSSLCQTLFLPF